MTARIADPATVAQLINFQDAFADMPTAAMLAADLFTYARAAAEIRRNAEGHVVELAPIDVTTLYLTTDHEGNTVYQQVVNGWTSGRAFLAHEILYLTRNRFL
jgi:hypothetical protein